MERLDQDDSAAWMQYSQCFSEEVSGLRKMMEHIDGIDGAETVIRKRESIGRHYKIDKGEYLYVAGDHFRIHRVNNAGPAANLYSLTRTILEVTQVHHSAFTVETLKQPAQDDLALNDLPMSYGKLRAIHVVRSNRGVNQPVSEPGNHRAPSGGLRPGNTLRHSCS